MVELLCYQWSPGKTSPHPWNIFRSHNWSPPAISWSPAEREGGRPTQDVDTGWGHSYIMYFRYIDVTTNARLPLLSTHLLSLQPLGMSAGLLLATALSAPKNSSKDRVHQAGQQLQLEDIQCNSCKEWFHRHN